MILYSVTVNIEDSVHQEWIQWMREVHVPDVMNTKCFVSNKIMRLLEPKQEGHTYSFQYFCASSEKLQEYQEQYAAALQADVAAKYANKFVAFRTILEVIE